jgi:hypothetical protein
MATQYANGRIVTNGLVLLYDASDRNSYTSGSTTIYDLSGNGNNGTLTNGPTFDTTNGGSIIFDGANDYIQFTSTYAGTICFWGIADAGYTTGLQALIGVTANGDGALRLQGGTFRAAAPNAPDGNDYQNGYVSQMMINGVTNLSYDASGFYVVPNSRTLTQNYFIGAIGNRNVSTISHTFNGRVYKGKVYKVALYNRQLTSSELLQNYNAQKSRFNL